MHRRLLAEHREAFVEETLRIITQVVGQLRAVDAILIDGVAELVQQCGHPARVRLHVQERAHVPFAIDVDRVGVLVLTLSRVQIAARQDGVDVAEAELTVGLGGQAALTRSESCEARSTSSSSLSEAKWPSNSARNVLYVSWTSASARVMRSSISTGACLERYASTWRCSRRRVNPSASGESSKCKRRSYAATRE